MSSNRKLPPWSWPGVVAIVLAAALGIGWAGSVIILTASPEPATDAGINFLSSLGQTLAGAVAAYIGYQIGSARQAPEQLTDVASIRQQRDDVIDDPEDMMSPRRRDDADL